MPAKKTQTKEYPVIGEDGKMVRVYNTKDHGRSAKKLAEQFAKKIKGKVK